MQEDQARAFLAEVEPELRRLEIAVNLAEWEATTTGTEAAQEAAAEAEVRLRRFLGSRQRYARIRELLDGDGADDPLVRRQLELLALDHRPNQLTDDMIRDLVRRSKEIESEFYNFRAVIDGDRVTDNELIRILRTETDERRRRAAWEASKQIGARVAGPLRELVRRRNDAARSLGFRDFYAMRLDLQEIDESDLLGLFENLTNAGEGPFRRVKSDLDRRVAARFGIRAEDVRPWHYDDPYFQEAPLSHDRGLDAFFRDIDLADAAARFYDGIGLPVRDVLQRSDLEERPGKDQHAYCTDIDREGDVRILCNLEDNERWMGILLHELGHAAYDLYIDRRLPWMLRQPSHTAMTEAIAMLMDKLRFDVHWIEATTGRPAADRNELAAETREAYRLEVLLMARWVPVMTRFERALYADPDRDDLDDLWWDLVEEHQLVPRPEGRHAPDWAAKIHLTVAPVYYHNYLLGELIAAQLRAAIARDALEGESPDGYYGRREVGAFLRRRIFEPGARWHWQEHLRRATGSRLTLHAFTAEFLAPNDRNERADPPSRPAT